MRYYTGMFHAILLLGLCHCSPKDKLNKITISPDFKVLRVDTHAIAKNVSDIATHIEYIPLETNDINLIGKIDKIEYHNSLFIILDKRISKALLVFDKSGKFLYKKKVNDEDLMNISAISDFTIDKENQRLFIYANENKKVLSFLLKNGKPVSSFSVQGFFSKCVFDRPNRFIFLRDGMKKYDDFYGESRVCATDSNGALISSWLSSPINPFVNAGEIFSSEGKIKNETLIFRMFNDTIYSVSDSTIAARYKIDIGTKPLPAEMLTTKKLDDFLALMESNSASYLTKNIFSTKQALSFFMKKKELICLSYFDKKTDSNFLIKHFVNDLDNTMLPLMSYMNDTCFVSVLNATTLQQQYNMQANSTDFKTKYATLINLNAQITNNSNPILALVSLK